MRIFLVGDFSSDTGPSIANKLLRKGLEGKDILYSKASTKPMRVLELLVNTLRADCVCFCSYSRINFLGLKIAKLFHKKTFYIMHGYKTYEYQMNSEVCDQEEMEQINQTEKSFLKNIDKVFCVSKKFMEFMKEAEPYLTEKFDFNYNSIDFEKIQLENSRIDISKKANQIVSIGGGMKQKNILTICRAVEKLNCNNRRQLNLIVIGLPYTDKEKICSYDFVTYYDRLPHKEVLEILAESNLYIQNSSFETFGLAVVEALSANCNLLLSASIGVTDLLPALKEKDVIYDVNDACEIAGKIEILLEEGNAQSLLAGLKVEEISYKTAATQLYNKIDKFMGEGQWNIKRKPM